MGGNIPGRNLLGGNFPGGNFPGGNFPRTYQQLSWIIHSFNKQLRRAEKRTTKLILCCKKGVC